MKRLVKLGAAVLITLLFWNCTNDNENISAQPIEIKSSSNKECKEFARTSSKEKSILAPDKTCIEYNYSNGILNLKHINTGFNCEPGELFATVKISRDTIIIEEHETSSSVKCLCLFDLDMELSGTNARVYQIKIIEPYLGEQKPLSFKADLKTEPSGSYCVKRNKYPWKNQ